MLAEPPEELELKAKRARLGELEEQLASRELEVSTLREELAAFERRYLRIVGGRLADLDAIRADIAELLAKQNPRNQELWETAARARDQATESSTAAAGSLAGFDETLERFSPPAELKRLYREIAKRIHPDLAGSDEERQLRTQLMAKLNEAYAERNESAMKAILEEWQSRPEAVAGSGVGQELIRMIRRIARAEARIRVLDEEERQLKSSAYFALGEKVLAADKAGRDLLGEIARQVDHELRTESERLEGLKAGLA